MKHSIYPRRSLIAMTAIAVCCLVLGVHSLRSVFLLIGFTTPFSLYVFLLGMSAVCFFAAMKMLVQLSEQVSITDDELTYYVRLRKDMSIRWDEIREVGIGQVYTPMGVRYCVFFARERLTDAEIDNLDLAGPKCIFMSSMTRGNFDMIREHWSGDELMLIDNWIQD